MCLKDQIKNILEIELLNKTLRQKDRASFKTKVHNSYNTVQSLYNMPCYITDLDTKPSYFGSQIFLPWNFMKEF